MSYTIPSDAHGSGDSGHVPDHNNLSDMAALLTAIGLQLYQQTPALPTGDASNPANVAALVSLLGSTATALLSSQLGAANGAASLDSSGLVPTTQLPVSSTSLFLAGSGTPASGTGFNGDTYEDTATGKLYAKASGAWSQNGMTGWSRLGTTGLSGYALANSTATIFSWTAPNDGNMHRFMFIGHVYITTATTGGTVNAAWTGPGGNSITNTVVNGTQAATGPVFLPGGKLSVCAPNTTVTFQQSTAMTAGAGTVYMEMWGS